MNSESAVCPFCDQGVLVAGVIFGGEILHRECFVKLGEELEASEKSEVVEA